MKKLAVDKRLFASRLHEFYAKFKTYTEEQELQVKVADYLDDLEKKDLIINWWHTPNGAYYGKGWLARKYGLLMRLLGVKKGIPDIQIIAHREFVFIELKTPKGRVSTEQNDFLECLKRQTTIHWIHGFCTSVDEVEKTLIEGAVI